MPALQFIGHITPLGDNRSYHLTIVVRAEGPSFPEIARVTVHLPKDQFYVRAQEHFNRLIRTLEEQLAK